MTYTKKETTKVGCDEEQLETIDLSDDGIDALCREVYQIEGERGKREGESEDRFVEGMW